jgi:hypothetical protein
MRDALVLAAGRYGSDEEQNKWLGLVAEYDAHPAWAVIPEPAPMPDDDPHGAA